MTATYRLDMMLFCKNWSHWSEKLFDCETMEFTADDDTYAREYSKMISEARWTRPRRRRPWLIYESEWNLFRKRPGGWDFITGGSFDVLDADTGERTGSRWD